MDRLQPDVLAGSPAEINHIAERLNQPSSELANWIAQRDGQQANEFTEGAVRELNDNQECALPESLNVGTQQVNVTEIRSCLIPDCSNPGTHRAPGGARKDHLCCEHYEQFIAHLLDPVGNPTFPSK